MFLDLSGRVLPKKISLWSGELGKDHPPSGGGCHSSSWDSDEANRWREGEAALCLSWDPILCHLRNQLPGLSVLLGLHYITCFSGSPACRWQMMDFTASENSWELIPVNCCLIVKLWFFCDPVDWSPPGSSVHGTLQVRILGWVAISFSRGSSWSRDWTCVSCLAGRFFTTESPGKPNSYNRSPLIYLCVCLSAYLSICCWNHFSGEP